MAQAFERCGTYDPNSRKRRSVQRKKMSELEFGRSIERHGIQKSHRVKVLVKLIFERK